jgi:hypothetical protein
MFKIQELSAIGIFDKGKPLRGFYTSSNAHLPIIDLSVIRLANAGECTLISDDLYEVPIVRSFVGEFSAVILRESHEGEHVGFRLVHQHDEFRHLRTQLIGHLAPLLARHLGVVLHEGGADEGGNDKPSPAPGMRQHVAHEVNPTPLP